MSARGWGRGGGRGGGRGTAAGRKPQQAQEDTSPKGLLASAAELDARASRRGAAVTPADCAAAATAYERALQAATATTDPSISVRALLGLGEMLQRQAEAVVDTARRRADLTAADERTAEDEALALLSSAAAACEQAFARAATTIPGGGNDHDARDMQEDAAANGARAMCAAAGVVLQRAGNGGGGEAALALLDRAVPLYEGLLSNEQQPQDDEPPVEALTDLADALMQRAEARAAALAAATGSPATAATAIATDASRALECYARACGACDSARGDDLPGLLHNWGVGLYTAASRLAPQAAAVQPSPFPPSTQLLGEAAGKLRAAAAFGRGDPQPHNALGDVLVALSERALAAAEPPASVAQAAATGLTSGGDNNDDTSLLGSAAAATRGALLAAQSSPRALSCALLRAAVGEGYGAALTLSRRDADGLMGCAEVAVLLGRQEQDDDAAEAARAHFAEGARLYAQALRDAPPQALGSVEERMACAWNGACAVALAGDVAGAAAALRALFARWPPPSASAEEARRQVVQEEDLRAVWSQPGWEGAVFG